MKYREIEEVHIKAARAWRLIVGNLKIVRIVIHMKMNDPIVDNLATFPQ